MHKRSLLFCVLSVILMTALLFSACQKAEDQAEPDYEERSSVKVGCLVSEEYSFFKEQIFYLAKYLQSARMMGSLPFNPENYTIDSKALWVSICGSDIQDNLTFASDVFYCYDTMDDRQKEAMLKNCDADLMLVFGTAAGIWLTENADDLPFDYMVFASADSITAGIVKSETERYNNRSFAHIDPGRIKRQIELSYELSGFTSIGVVYEDSPAAYSYSGIRYVEELSEQYGFAVHTVHVDEPKDYADRDRYYSELKAAYHSMLNDIDVLYITTGMIEDEMLPWLLEEVHEAGIITVAETSESQVEYGAMLYITMSNAREEGQFAAKTLLDYTRGVPVDKLEQVFLITPHISLNQTTIEKTGTKIPLSIYLIADNVYQGVKHAQ